MPSEVWIIDTSAVAEVRRRIPVSERRAVFESLSAKLGEGTLAYPRQVLDEFERAKSKNQYDHGWEWVKKCAHHCKSHEPLHEYVRQVLSDQQVARVLDPNKDHEEADPYILALALKYREIGAAVGVITEDAKSRPDKLSLKDACGLLRIVSISMLPFLEQNWIWPNG